MFIVYFKRFMHTFFLLDLKCSLTSSRSYIKSVKIRKLKRKYQQTIKSWYHTGVNNVYIYVCVCYLDYYFSFHFPQTAIHCVTVSSIWENQKKCTVFSFFFLCCWNGRKTKTFTVHLSLLPNSWNEMGWRDDEQEKLKKEREGEI